MTRENLVGNIWKSHLPKTVLKKIQRVQTIQVYDLKGNLQATFIRQESEENTQ